jgi:hypothetical protein
MAALEDNLLVVGGKASISGTASSVVDKYDTSFVRANFKNLPSIRATMAGTSVGDYVLFGGGDSGSTSNKRDDVYVYKNFKKENS